LNLGVKGIRAFDIFADDGRDINVKIREQLEGMDKRDFYTFTQQLELLNFGWRNEKKKLYFSGGLYEELDFIAYFPKDFATFTLIGNEDPLGKELDISQLKSTAALLTVFHFGMQKKMNKQLTVGGRLKIYSELASYRAIDNSGKFITEQLEDGNNVYTHTLESVNINIQTSGYAAINTLNVAGGENVSKDIQSELTSRALLGGNLGMGIDFGLTYQFEDNWVVTGSVTDLGFITHSKDVETYQVRGTYEFEGLETPTKNDPIRLDTFLEDLESRIAQDTITRSYTTFRSAKLQGSLRKSFHRITNSSGCDCWWQNDDEEQYAGAYGVQVFSQFRPRGPQFAASAFIYRRIFSNLRVKATYTLDSFSFHNVGLLLSTNISVFNFYIAGDNLIDYANLAKARSASLQFGFNLIF